jgi:SWI/SNF-related matrix-associated actin-dependent regulator 1 of chromatin subfamily A
VDAQRARADALEARLEEREAEAARRAAEEAESRAARAEATAAALDEMDAALRALSVGDAGGIDAALAAQVDALERTRRDAQTYGALGEAAGTGASAGAIAEAREALARGDLFAARIALWRAALAARSANALGVGAGGGGAPAGPGY